MGGGAVLGAELGAFGCEFVYGVGDGGGESAVYVHCYGVAAVGDGFSREGRAVEVGVGHRACGADYVAVAGFDVWNGELVVD